MAFEEKNKTNYSRAPFTWQIRDTGFGSAEENMAQDKAWLESLTPDADPILHFYEWNKDSVTYGYFVLPKNYLDLSRMEKRGFVLAKRPTGGGIIFHTWDLAFSVLIPANHPGYSHNTLDCYAFINEAVLNSVKIFLGSDVAIALTPVDAVEFDPSCGRFCMAKPTKYDVILEGKKIAGAAQRKCRQGFLHQGSIALSLPCEEILRDILLPETKVIEAMRSYTYPLMGEKATISQIHNAKKELKELLKINLIRQQSIKTT